LGEVGGVDGGEDVDHYRSADFVTASGPLRLLLGRWCEACGFVLGLRSLGVCGIWSGAYYSVHPLEMVDLGVVVGFVEFTFSAPGCGGAVLFVSGFWVVGAGDKEASVVSVWLR